MRVGKIYNSRFNSNRSIFFQSLFVVQEISQAIVLQFGDPKKIVTKAGLNFKLPFIQNVVYLDRRI